MSRRYFLAAALAAASAFFLMPAAADAPKDRAIVEGIDYEVIPDGQAFAPVKGKVEVVEVFGYTCPHCAHFEPQVSAWKARHTKDVNFVALAAPFGQIDIDMRSHRTLRSGPAPYEPAHWTLHEAAVPKNYFATVAVWSDDAVRG